MGKLVIETDGKGNYLIGGEGIPPEMVEVILLGALAGVQRVLLAKKVVELQREGIQVVATLPGDGGRGH